jgi:hypothetical protein
MIDKLHRYFAARRIRRHNAWLRRMRVVYTAPNPRAIVQRRWRVPL